MPYAGYYNQYPMMGNQNYAPQNFTYGNFQQPMQQQTPPQLDTLFGKVVDSVDVVRSINADMSGQPNWYPKSDGSEVYCKKINPTTGASMIMTYKLDAGGEQPSTEQQLTTLISNVQTQLSNEIADLKQIVMNSSKSTTQKAGAAK